MSTVNFFQRSQTNNNTMDKEINPLDNNSCEFSYRSRNFACSSEGQGKGLLISGRLIGFA